MRPLFVSLLAVLALAIACAAEIEIAPVEGFNLRIIDRPSPTIIEVQPNPGCPNWFAGKFINLPVGQPLEIRLNMNGCDTRNNVANTGKWQGLRPLYTYADPEQYETYEWFRKDAQGRWVSGDLFKKGPARLAGTGPVPEQTVIPAGLASCFLTDDQTFWYPWQEILGGQPNTDTRIFTFTVTPEAPIMTIAMHVPYTLAFERELVKRLKAARLPGVFVDELGVSGGGRPLYLIRVDDPAQPAALQINPAVNPRWEDRDWKGRTVRVTDLPPTVRISPLAPGDERRLFFLDAREHPSETAGSWPVLGALKALTADSPQAARLRKGNTWVLLPIFDPDGVAAGEFDIRCEKCWLADQPGFRASIPEALADIAYLRAFVNAGWFFAASAAFYNLECTEGKTVCVPFADAARKDQAVDFNRFWFARLQAAGIAAGPEEPWGAGWLPFRLATGCALRGKALTLIFEVNDRYPDNRQTTAGLELIGADYVRSITDWMATPAGAQAMAYSRAAQHARRLKIAQDEYGNGDYHPDKPSLHQLLVEGH
ncbi:MAG: M14 family zinc carboxypeptidase [Armatimonadota bacterium]